MIVGLRYLEGSSGEQCLDKICKICKSTKTKLTAQNKQQMEFSPGLMTVDLFLRNCRLHKNHKAEGSHVVGTLNTGNAGGFPVMIPVQDIHMACRQYITILHPLPGPARTTSPGPGWLTGVLPNTKLLRAQDTA